jgi:hypothetical protein
MAPDPTWLELLRPKSRALPDADRVDLGASDWPGVAYGLGKPGNPWTQEHAPDWKGCTPDIVRYKIYKGKVYTDHDHYSKKVPSLYQR